MTRLLMLCLLLASLGLPAALPAQEDPSPPAPLEEFVGRVVLLWASGDAGGIANLAPADGRMVLDVGGANGGAVQARHVAAALRALFTDRENVSVRPTRVTVAGGTPMRGFGEIVWVSRSRGVTVPRSATVYIGMIWEAGAWRVHELRIMS